MVASYALEKREQRLQYGRSDSVWSAPAPPPSAEGVGAPLLAADGRDAASEATQSAAAAASLPAAWDEGKAGSVLERAAAYGFMVGEYGLFLFFISGMASGLSG